MTVSAFSETVTHTVTLQRETLRQLNDNAIKLQIDGIVSATNNGRLAQQGWKIEAATIPPRYAGRPHTLYRAVYKGGTEYTYYVPLRVTCELSRPRPSVEAEFELIVATINQRGKTWQVSEVDDAPWAHKPTGQLPLGTNGQADTEVGYMPLVLPDRDAWWGYFDKLYGLDSHIERVYSALSQAVDSTWRNRFHCVLQGPPGCGKTALCQAVKAAVGEESVLEFDATSTTQAGALDVLANRPLLPRVLMVEEIEKAPTEALSWLLAILDQRAEIRKTTKTAKIERDVHMFGICTVNDVDLFKRINSGALASRFSGNEIYFKRPTRELLAKILEREILAVGGSLDWIVPTLDYAAEVKTSDPRRVTAIALCGRDRLLDGSYQQILNDTSREENA